MDLDKNTILFLAGALFVLVGVLLSAVATIKIAFKGAAVEGQGIRGWQATIGATILFLIGLALMFALVRDVYASSARNTERLERLMNKVEALPTLAYFTEEDTGGHLRIVNKQFGDELVSAWITAGPNSMGVLEIKDRNGHYIRFYGDGTYHVEKSAKSADWTGKPLP